MAAAALRTGEYPIGNEFHCERDSTTEYKPIPWRRILRRLIESGVRPESIGSLSPAQLRIILLRTRDYGETVQLTPAEAKELRRPPFSRTRSMDREATWRKPHGSQNRLHRGIEVFSSIANSLANIDEQSPPPSFRRQDSVTEEPTLHRAMCDLANRIDELLAKSLRPNGTVRPEFPAASPTAHSVLKKGTGTERQRSSHCEPPSSSEPVPFFNAHPVS